MDRKEKELLHTLLFTIIAIGNVFLFSRYYNRDDILGASIFILVASLSLIAAIGYYITLRKKKK